MKLITLNVWGGGVYDKLMEFVKLHAGDADIFCLQEVFSNPSGTHPNGRWRSNLLEDFKKILHEYDFYFAPKSFGYDYSGSVDVDVYFGNVIFIKKGIPVSFHEEIFGIIDHPNHNWQETAIGKAQFIKFAHEQKEFVVCNFHGLWKNGSNKKDDTDRLAQSQLIKDTLDQFDCAKILCGDFNLLPNSASIKILEEGTKNLITDYNILSTRSSLYKKEIRFADYVLVSPNVDVKTFEVLKDEVSDHLALALDFN